jgi:Predicted multitransmembrane protein
MITLLAIIILVLIPTGFEKVVQPNSVRAKAEILEVDNSLLRQYGIVREGDQVCKIKILNGKFKGQEISGGVNHLTGKMEMDKIFEPGDKAFVVLDTKDGKITFANLVDHYRINLELVLFAAFILILILFAGWTGVKSVLSFTLTVLIIWKILIPGFLKGYNPIILSLLVVTAMTVSTILLVSGTNKKSIVAILGSLSGSALTCILSIIFGYYFKVHGALMPFSETLMYSGYANLKLTDIFIAGIFVASAGALMDLAMDISAAIHEIVEKNPEITRHEAIKSGFSIGRAVMGTMTTTLLLAYSGGYVALLMVFMAQGTPVENILNLRYVSGEILHTIVGSFGLVTVAPFTAILAGVFFVPDQAVNLIENDSH